MTIPRRILDPTERFSEILFGLVMVLTFTGTLSVTDAGREDVREMLVAALGCNLAWGIVDGVMYLINAVTMRARGNVLIRRLRSASDRKSAHELIADTLPARVAAVLGPDELETMRTRLVALPETPARLPIKAMDLVGAAYVGLLVFLATLPVALPFLVVHEVRPALRISNAIALVMLFFLGHSLARYTGGRPIRVGLAMLLLGGGLVALTIALGG